MDAGPVSIFAPDPELGVVVDAILALPGLVACEPDGADTEWRSIRVAIDDVRGVRELVVQHDPEYWGEPSITTQVNGMRRFYESFGVDQITGPRLGSLGAIGFALTIAGGGGQPDPYLDDRDPAAWLARALALALDGLVFAGAEMLDTEWRVVLGAAPDADATPPSWVADPPADERVARRLIVLTALYLRGDLENLDDPDDLRNDWRDRLVTWVRDGDAWSELEPGEAELMMTPVGALDTQTRVNLEWRIEGAAVLAWALGLMPAPSDDALVEPIAVIDAIGGLDEPPFALIRHARLRSHDDVLAAQNHLFFWHWRFVDQRVRPRRMDFGSFGATASFGRFGPTEFRLLDGDLAVAGRPISTADPAAVAAFTSAALERQLAVNWLVGGHLYSESSPDT